MKNPKPLRPPKPSRYIDLLSDHGFKYIFGREPNKDLLIHFLNELIRGEKNINDIQYSKNEFYNAGEQDGAVIFDLLCTGDKGEKFLIEVQRTRQGDIIERSVAYVSRLISDHIPKGRRKVWQVDITGVYFIAILETFSIDTENNLYLRTLNLRCNENNKVYYEKMKYIFVELCNFTKDIKELNSDLDKWLYILKNISRLDEIPLYMKNPVFQKLFKMSEYSKLSKDERFMYDLSIQNKWIALNSMNYEKKCAREEGLAEGRAEGIEKGLAEGMEKGMEKKNREFISYLICKSQMTDIEIAEATGAEISLVEEIRKQLRIKNYE